MGLMDSMKGKFDGMDDKMRERFEELKSKEQSGDLDDGARMELQQLRSRFEHKD